MYEKDKVKSAGYRNNFRDLPMGRHHAEALQDPKLFEAFKHFVMVEEELLHLLEMRVDKERKMLIEMGKAAADYGLRGK
jgi:hypothetical protein